MNTRRFWSIGLLLALLLAALPLGALAAPSVTVSPSSGPRGTAIGVSAFGLAPDTAHLVQVVRGVGNVNTVRVFEETARSDARGELHYRLAMDQDQGQYTVRIVSVGGTVLASAPFTVTPGAGVPTLTIAPERGPCTTQPALGGRDFPAGATVAIYGQRLDPSGGAASAPQLVNTVMAAPNGDLAPFTQPLPADCDAARTPDGTRFAFTAVPPGASIDATTEPERRVVFTVARGAAPDGRHFPETGHTVRGRFLAYWRAYGLNLGDANISERESLALFGYPISGEFEQRLEDGKTYTVQYFERARMEYHPEHEGTPHEVLLGQFGRQIVASVPGAPTGPVPARTEPYAVHFRETGHNVAPDFANFWSRSGGLEVFGYPLSEEFEQQLEDGQVYTVQYFERARFERHPAKEGTPYAVQLGQFGRLILGPTGGPGVPR